MSACVVEGCVALAEAEGKCAIHRSLRRVAFKTNCTKCGYGVPAGKWHWFLHDHASCYPKCKTRVPGVVPVTQSEL